MTICQKVLQTIVIWFELLQVGNEQCSLDDIHNTPSTETITHDYSPLLEQISLFERYDLFILRMVLTEGQGIRPGTRFWRGPDKHDYHLNRTMAGGRFSMRCVMYFLEKCHGRASVSANGKSFRQTQAHNHDPDRHRVEARSLRHALMDRCRRGDHTPFKRMYHEERRKLQ